MEQVTGQRFDVEAQHAAEAIAIYKAVTGKSDAAWCRENPGEWGKWERAAIAASECRQQAARAMPTPENVRDGEPYDDPAFEDLARTMGVWGTAQAALCAQFFLAGRSAMPAGVEPAGEVVLFGGDPDCKEISGRKGAMPPAGAKLYTAAQVLAMQSELEQIGAVAACFGADWPDADGEPEVLRRVKWAARQLKAAQERAPLTDERIREIDDETHFHEAPDWPVRFARAIEAEARKKAAP